MLVKILSDLHLSPMSNDFKYIDHGEHVCVLAGDIAEGMRGVNWAEVNIPNHIDVLYVPGNHEYYGREYNNLNSAFASYNKEGSHVRVLMNEVVELHGVRFAGTSLWVNFNLYNDPMSSYHWKHGLNDSMWIKYTERNLSAVDVMRFNADAISFLEKADADVLITHHAPHFSESPKWANHPLTPGFLTKIPEHVHRKFKLHIHGHTHSNFDYDTPYGTRVICNPRGYFMESSSFNEELVINI